MCLTVGDIMSTEGEENGLFPILDHDGSGKRAMQMSFLSEAKFLFCLKKEEDRQCGMIYGFLDTVLGYMERNPGFVLRFLHRCNSNFFESSSYVAESAVAALIQVQEKQASEARETEYMLMEYSESLRKGGHCERTLESPVPSRRSYDDAMAELDVEGKPPAKRRKPEDKDD